MLEATSFVTVLLLAVQEAEESLSAFLFLYLFAVLVRIVHVQHEVYKAAIRNKINK